ncbi:ATP-dependent Clp protease proteolytic subunit [Bradyrhizobium sp. LjRoot220]|uniref:ATP-dependent Clp protease proteolytic subunit n=1 Tax=Bradyrhizobium sp. LjRoot220 TaxID=3342284 RepID=UPI003ECC1CF1
MSNALTLAAGPLETSAANHGADQIVGNAPPPLTFIAPLPPPLPRQPAQNFMARHWRGELSLPRSYWINYLLLGIGVGLALGALSAAVDLRAIEQPVYWLISLGLTWGVISLFTIWGGVGVWRAATAYRRAGKRFWGVAAKVIIGLGALHLVYSLLFVAIPQSLGIYEIVAGDTRLASHQFKVLNNGTMLDFSGGISFGTAKEFETMLKAMDNVRTVRLNSNGGRIAEAQKIADLIKARGLSTYVTQQCASACTIMFLGGKQRHLHASARLGFHQPYFRGMTANEQRVVIAREQARLQKFGLSHAFAERANAASPSGMWFPEQSELLRERVVTSIFTPPPPKPVASATPAPSASAAKAATAPPALQATRTTYQGAPQ